MPTTNNISQRMKKVKSKNTDIEVTVRKILHSLGYRFILNSSLPGHPDIVLPKYKTAIFVNGCFWHGHKSCKKGRLKPITNKEFWNKKIQNNVKRDKKNYLLLKNDDWNVIKVWECNLKNLKSFTGKINRKLKKNFKTVEQRKANYKMQLFNPAAYFKSYRNRLGFTNQSEAKEFLAGKDIIPSINYDYIKLLNKRISDIIYKIDSVIAQSLKKKQLDLFVESAIYEPYDKINQAQILPRLNNQGRRPEEVLFSWLRGYAIAEYFEEFIGQIFNITSGSFLKTGDDNFTNIDTFKRSPKADLEFKRGCDIIRIEVQSGFQGVNDIKEHKVREAHRVFDKDKIKTICIHFDIYNGQAAFVRLDTIADNDMNWVTRQQMEGQSVFAIDQNYFKWRMLENPPTLNDLEVNI